MFLKGNLCHWNQTFFQGLIFLFLINQNLDRILLVNYLQSIFCCIFSFERSYSLLFGVTAVVIITKVKLLNIGLHSSPWEGLRVLKSTPNGQKRDEHEARQKALNILCKPKCGNWCLYVLAKVPERVSRSLAKTSQAQGSSWLPLAHGLGGPVGI